MAYEIQLWGIGRNGPNAPDLAFLNTDDVFNDIIQLNYINVGDLKNAELFHDDEAMLLCKSTDRGLFWGRLKFESFPRRVTVVPLINPGTVIFPVVQNDLVQFSDTRGVTEDAGIPISGVQLKTQVKVAQSGNIGGAGAGPVDIAISGVTSTSIAKVSIVSSSNAVSIETVVPGTDKISVTFSGDPGASAIVSYIVYLLPQ